MNICEMFKLVEKNELVLPDFQRDYVWNRKSQKALAASLLLNLPIGSFLILEGEKDDFATKKIGFPTKEANPTDECKFLLDGQQRLTSLKSIFSDFFADDEWRQNAKDIYAALKLKWFLRIVPIDGEEDIFGWNDLYFDENLIRNIEPAQLEEMIVDKTVGVSKGNCWWNPNFTYTKNDGTKLNRKDGKGYFIGVSKCMADEKLIPLDIYTDIGKQMLSYSLEYIANERSVRLKVELEENLQRANEIIDKADINTLFDEITVEDIPGIVNNLKEKWKVNLQSYLTNLLDKAEAQIISLKSNEIGRAVVIFERINKGGTNLDNFDLVVARAARDKAKDSLTKRIIKYLESEISLPESLISDLKGEKINELDISYMNTVKDNEIDSIIKKQYLNLLSVLSYIPYGNVSEIKLELTKKEKILNIPYQDINDFTPEVLKGLSRACAFLQIRCGIVSIKELHYNLMLMPIAYVLLDDNVWNDKKSLDKIEYWYWISIFSGEYRIYPNERSLKDLQEIYNWIVNGEEVPRLTRLEAEVLNVKGFCDKDLLVRNNYELEIPIAIHKGILQYELSRQPVDLLNYKLTLNTWDIAKTIEIKVDDNKSIKAEINDHHIIPLGTKTNILESTKEIRKEKTHILNSILNRTYIFSDTNNIFSAKEPAKYLKQLEENNSTHMLNTHFIPDSYKDYLSSDAISKDNCIKKFFELRYEKLKTILLAELDNLKN